MCNFMMAFAMMMFALCFVIEPCFSEKPLVLLISFDGFRWDYLSRTSTPHFDKLIKTGVKAKWLQDVFVTQTFPNHYTLATGLYEESHGVVSNIFYDPSLKREFSYHRKDDVGESTFWGGEPIWVTNQIQGGKTGVFFWIGSEAPIKGIRPTQWRPYSVDFPWTERVDTVVDWLANKPTGKDNKVNDINLALLYFPQPDRYGHIYGPESFEVTKVIGKCDNITGYLMDKLVEENLYDKVNVIITSDHGMASLDEARTIPILPHLNLNHTVRLLNLGTIAGVWPKKGDVDLIYQNLSNMGPHVKVWKRENIPRHFHYSNNERIPPIVIMPRDGWFLVNSTQDHIGMKGSHGYNNSLMDMHPFFIAHGPAFREDYVSEPFSSVHIYTLICHIMGLKPAPNNGSLSAVEQLLKPTSTYQDYVLKICGIVIVACSLLLAIICGGMFIKRTQKDTKGYHLVTSDDRGFLLQMDTGSMTTEEPHLGSSEA